MSKATTVRWGVRITIDGERRRIIEGGRPWSGTFKQALAGMATWEDNKPRLVRITRKKKPQVQERTVIDGVVSMSMVADSSRDLFVLDPKTGHGAHFWASDWNSLVERRIGKRVRLIIEELGE